jgi:hypothetical protein
MKRQGLSLLIFLFLISACSGPHQTDNALAPINNSPVEYYAVLAEKDDYKDVDMTDLLVDYINIQRLRTVLEELGWQSGNIHEIEEYDQGDLKAELDWLEEVVDDNDLVFFYVTGHGTYLRRHIKWSNFFPEEWAQIKAGQRVLLVDSCTAAEFTKTIKEDPNPYISIAAVDEDEYGWAGLEEEGLPIIGGVFTYYFAEALVDPNADSNGDGSVSVQEAALLAEEGQRSYMHEVVFAVPEFVKMYHDIGVTPDQDQSFPDVILDDNVGNPVILQINE